jgi:transcriptional regulator with XRE-family HTH domain
MYQINLKKIRNLREQNGLSQEEVAKYLGYKSAQGYHYLEKGRCQIKGVQLTALASLFGVPIQELYSEMKPDEKRIKAG